jgi:hypothetical protein
MLSRWLENKELKYGLSVPYSQGTEPGNTNIGYFDLKRHPENISQIHELNNYPEFFELIKTINLPTSIFRTLRCDARSDSIKFAGYNNAVSCYVTIIFEILNWNWPEDNFRRLYDLFLGFRFQPLPPDTTRFDFIPVPVDFIDDDCGVRGLDIYIHGIGQSKEEAQEACRLVVVALQEFLSRQSEENLHLLQHLKDGEKTVS